MYSVASYVHVVRSTYWYAFIPYGLKFLCECVNDIQYLWPTCIGVCVWRRWNWFKVCWELLDYQHRMLRCGILCSAVQLSGLIVTKAVSLYRDRDRCHSLTFLDNWSAKHNRMCRECLGYVCTLCTCAVLMFIMYLWQLRQVIGWINCL